MLRTIKNTTPYIHKNSFANIYKLTGKVQNSKILLWFSFSQFFTIHKKQYFTNFTNFTKNVRAKAHRVLPYTTIPNWQDTVQNSKHFTLILILFPQLIITIQTNIYYTNKDTIAKKPLGFDDPVARYFRFWTQHGDLPARSLRRKWQPLSQWKASISSSVGNNFTKVCSEVISEVVLKLYWCLIDVVLTL